MINGVELGEYGNTRESCDELHSIFARMNEQHNILLLGFEIHRFRLIHTTAVPLKEYAT